MSQLDRIYQMRKMLVGRRTVSQRQFLAAFEKVIWWKHSSKAGQYSAARVHDSLRTLLNNDGTFDEALLRAKFTDLEPEIIDGF